MTSRVKDSKIYLVSDQSGTSKTILSGKAVTLTVTKGIMKKTLKRWSQMTAVCACAACLLCPAPEVRADELDSLENESSGLQSNLESINSELLEIGNQIARNENELEGVNNDITKTEEQLAIAKNNEDDYYAEMKIRIQYMYENDGESMLGLIFSADSFPDFINKVQFVQTVSEYDRNMFKELQELRSAIEKEEKHLKKQQDACVKLEKELNGRRKELKAKADATSTDIAALEAKIQDMKEQQAAEAERAAEEARRAEAEKKAAEEAANAEASRQQEDNSAPADNNSGSIPTSGTADSSGSGGDYSYAGGDGVLTPSKGVNNFGGHRETYYSQKVLPGHGLVIPGRHVAEDGTIRDANGFLCLASSDYPKGTQVMTSLGMGIVYDTGCASGTIDIYTDW